MTIQEDEFFQSFHNRISMVPPKIENDDFSIAETEIDAENYVNPLVRFDTMPVAASSNTSLASLPSKFNTVPKTSQKIDDNDDDDPTGGATNLRNANTEASSPRDLKRANYYKMISARINTTMTNAQNLNILILGDKGGLNF